jgi:hypothetical protein
MDTKFASFSLHRVLNIHLRVLQLDGGILGKEAEAASSLAQSALWALQIGQHLDWLITNTNKQRTTSTW